MTPKGYGVTVTLVCNYTDEEKLGMRQTNDMLTTRRGLSDIMNYN